MPKTRIIVLLLLFLLLPTGIGRHINKSLPASTPQQTDARSLFSEMQLEGIVNYKAFKQAISGYREIGRKHRELLTIIDYSKPSTDERLYVIDMKGKKLICKSLVSHGKNSGNLYATSFSNKYGSYQSSLGFFITENTYNGKNGYSLVLDGLEKGINDMAKQRSIVIHGASYSNPSVIQTSGRLGRSLGCPALPEKESKEIINLIKGGSLLYIYADNPDYLALSSITHQE